MSKMVNYYEQLHKLTEEITELGVIDEDSSNILQMVSDGYSEFVKKIQFFDNAPPNLQIKYETRCGKEFFSPVEQSKCENAEMGEEYEFTISVTALEYPEDGNRQQTIRIEETSTSSEYMEVEINIEDDCPCLAGNDAQLNSPTCNLHGKLSCGMCLCDSGYSGKTCECDLLNYSSSKELDQNCRLPITDRNGTTSLGPICSDRGAFICHIHSLQNFYLNLSLQVNALVVHAIVILDSAESSAIVSNVHSMFNALPFLLHLLANNLLMSFV